MVFYLPKRGKRALLAPINLFVCYYVMFLFTARLIKRNEDGGADVEDNDED